MFFNDHRFLRALSDNRLVATENTSSLMTTLLCRSFTIVSDYHKLHKEIVELKSVLRENCCNTLPSLTH